MGQAAHLLRLFIAQYGLAALFVPLVIEEAGVWLPVPGDVFVMYFGYRASQAPLPLVAALPALAVVTGAVTCGSFILYMVTRRFRDRVLRLGRLVHLHERRLHWMEGWVQRHGVRAIVPGRLIPGLRIPTTVVAGLFDMPAERFVPAAVVGGAVWAGFYLVLGGMGHTLLGIGARADVDAAMPDAPFEWVVTMIAFTAVILLGAAWMVHQRPRHPGA